MIVLVPIVIVASVGIAACTLELMRRQPTATELSRGYRAGLAFLLGIIALVVLSPQLALVFDRPLPVDPPVNPLAGEGCRDDSSDDAVIFVIVLAMYVGARAGLGVLAAIVRAVARPPSRVVTGKPAMAVAAIFLGVVFPIVSARLLVPGPAPDELTTYGALTPDRGARGWRVDHLVDAKRAGPLAPLPRLATAVSDINPGGSGHGTFSTGPYLRSGVHAWVADEPVLIFRERDALVGAPVEGRTPSVVPPERRPRFQSWPLVALRPGADGWLLVERRADGSVFAMQTYGEGRADAVEPRDVWLLVRPSEIPHGIAFVLFLLGLAAARTSHRRGHTPGFALLAAWLWLEAGALDLFAYAPYLGL